MDTGCSRVLQGHVVGTAWKCMELRFKPRRPISLTNFQLNVFYYCRSVLMRSETILKNNFEELLFLKGKRDYKKNLCIRHIFSIEFTFRYMSEG